MYYLGIDPGKQGALAIIKGADVETCRCEVGEHEVWRWVAQFIGQDVLAVIEQQTPRPTWISDENNAGKKRPTVLASTCILFGGYTSLKTMLMCAGIPLMHDCPAQVWQAEIGLPKKEKNETSASWKGKLKIRAQELFPALKVTLHTADALLIAAYCLQKYRSEK